MSKRITLKTNVQLGVVPTHLKFVGALVPDEHGRLPRNSDGVLVTVAGMRDICESSPVKLNCVQIPFFASAAQEDVGELVSGLRALDLDVHFIMMVGGASPMNPADEDAVVAQLVTGLKAAIGYGVAHVSSTSVEEWLGSYVPSSFEAAVQQNVKVHLRAYEEAGLAGSCVENWHIEFLRPVEFKTFTSIERGWAFVKAANAALGKKFFKLLVDAAHCGNSGLSIPENERCIAEMGAAGELGIYHASAPTTRGCLSTDDGWVGSLLTAAAKTGELRHVFVELFHHEDPALEPLRNLVEGHGVDTRDGRSYHDVTVAGVEETAHRLNNLLARGILKS